MDNVIYFVALPFRRSEDDGSIVAGEPVEARSRDQALRLAGTLAATEGNCEAIAFSRKGDPALGDFEDAVIITTVGEVDAALLSAQPRSLAGLSSCVPVASRKVTTLSSTFLGGRGSDGRSTERIRAPADFSVKFIMRYFLPDRRSQNSSRLLVRGKGSAGTGTLRNAQSGPQPSFTW
jgi:hypothetical protein